MMRFYNLRYTYASLLIAQGEHAKNISSIERKKVAEQELRMGVRTRKLSRVRAKVSYHLSHEFGVSRAEIARQLGGCTSAIAKTIQNIEP